MSALAADPEGDQLQGFGDSTVDETNKAEICSAAAPESRPSQMPARSGRGAPPARSHLRCRGRVRPESPRRRGLRRRRLSGQPGRARARAEARERGLRLAAPRLLPPARSREGGFRRLGRRDPRRDAGACPDRLRLRLLHRPLLGGTAGGLLHDGVSRHPPRGRGGGRSRARRFPFLGAQPDSGRGRARRRQARRSRSTCRRCLGGRRTHGRSLREAAGGDCRHPRPGDRAAPARASDRTCVRGGSRCGRGHATRLVRRRAWSALGRCRPLSPQHAVGIHTRGADEPGRERCQGRRRADGFPGATVALPLARPRRRACHAARLAPAPAPRRRSAVAVGRLRGGLPDLAQTTLEHTMWRR